MPNKLIAPSFRHFKHFLLVSLIPCVFYENISLSDFTQEEDQRATKSFNIDHSQESLRKNKELKRKEKKAKKSKKAKV